MDRVRQLLTNKLANANPKELRNFVWESVASYGSIAASLVTMVLLFNQLGRNSFGLYAGTMALAMLVGPFAALGFGQVLVRDAASGNHSLERSVSRGVAVFGVGITIGTLGLIASLPILASATPFAVGATLVVSEIVFGRIMVVTRQIARSVGDSRGASLPQLVSRFGRAIAAVGFVLSDQTSLGVWVGLHLGVEVIAALSGLFVVKQLGGIPSEAPDRPSVAYAREGLLYSFNGSAIGIKNDADKAMLAGFGFAEVTAAYAVAYRVIQAAVQPLNALLNATLTKFFRIGQRSPNKIPGMAVRHTAVGGAYAVLCGAALWLAAPLLTRLLDDGEIDPSVIVRALAALPVLIAGQQYAARGLTATGRQLWVTRILLGAAGLNVAMNFVLIPRYDWRGAVIATLLSDLLVAVCLWVALLRSEPLTGDYPEKALE